MNYKKIVRSRRTRFIILRLLSWVPDSLMLRIQYRIKQGIWPNFKHPQRYTEKVQLYKMHYRNPVMFQCVDKYEVRDYVKNRGLDDILVPLIGVYDDAKDIDFKQLPEKFVIKTTDGGGGNNVLICTDKTKIDWPSEILQINGWRNLKDIDPGREWAYTGMKKSRIIVEEFLESDDNDLTDYKFYCFNGKPYYCQVITGRRTKECIDFFDKQWVHQNFVGLNPGVGNAEICPEKPSNYEEMWGLAGQLAGTFPFVRVDLYSVKGKTYFGELTFYPASGYGEFKPDEVDFELGAYFTGY